MTVVAITQRKLTTVPGKGYHYTETITTGATGDSIKIPTLAPGKNITCTIIAGANTGRFETTTSSDASVAAGTATWLTWPLGTQTGTVSDSIISPVTGIRGASSAGEITIEVVI